MLLFAAAGQSERWRRYSLRTSSSNFLVDCTAYVWLTFEIWRRWWPWEDGYWGTSKNFEKISSLYLAQYKQWSGRSRGENEYSAVKTPALAAIWIKSYSKVFWCKSQRPFSRLDVWWEFKLGAPILKKEAAAFSMIFKGEESDVKKAGMVVLNW